MAEEEIVLDGDEIADNDEAKDTEEEKDSGGKDLTEIEEAAIEIGWDPEYDGEDAVDARTFIINSREIQDSMRKKNKNSEREIKRLTKAVEDIKNYYRKLDEVRAEKLASEIERLKEERYEAIEEGDIEKVRKLDNKIDKTEQQVEPLIEDDYDNPEFDEWVEDNPWYGVDPELTEYADAQATLDKYKGVPYKRVLKLVEKTTREMFPEKFNSGRQAQSQRNMPPKVEGRTTGRIKRKPTKADLTPEQREVMKSIMSVSDDMTEEEYIKGLQEAGEL